MADRMAASAEL
jgi:hypothetical protein